MSSRFEQSTAYWTARAEFESAYDRLNDALRSMELAELHEATQPEYVRQRRLQVHLEIYVRGAQQEAERGNFDKSLMYFERRLELRDTEPFRLDLIGHCRAFGKTATAERFLRSWLTESEPSYPLQMALADVLLDQQRANEAELLLQTMDASKAEQDRRWLTLWSTALLQQNRLDELLAELESRDRVGALQGLYAAVLQMAGRPRDSEAAWQQLVEQNPDQPAFAVEALHAGAKFRSPGTIARGFRSLVDRFPDRTEVFSGRGRWYGGRTATLRAQRDFKHALSLTVGTPPSSYLGRFYYDLELAKATSAAGDHEQAIRTFEALHQQIPGFPTVSTQLGWEYLQQRKPRHAVKAFRNRCTMEPQNPAAHVDVLEAILASEHPGGARNWERKISSLLAANPSQLSRARERGVGLFGYRPDANIGVRARFQWLTSRPTPMLFSRELAFSASAPAGFRTDQWIHQMEVNVALPGVPLFRTRYTGVVSFIDQPGYTNKIEWEGHAGLLSSAGSFYAQPNATLVIDQPRGTTRQQLYRIGRMRIGWRPAGTALRTELHFSAGSEPTDKKRRSSFFEGGGAISSSGNWGRIYAAFTARQDKITSLATYQSYISELALGLNLPDLVVVSTYLRLEHDVGLPRVGYATALESLARVEKQSIRGMISPFLEVAHGMPFRAPAYQSLHLRAGLSLDHQIRMPVHQRGATATAKMPVRWTLAFERTQFPYVSVAPSNGIMFNVQVF